MDSDGYGEGRGGVGQVYEVASSSNVSCVTQQSSGRADWPAGLQVSPVSPTSTAWGAAPTNTSTNTATDVQTASTSPSASSLPDNNGGSNTSLSSGAIAGIAVGAAAVVVAIIAFVLFYLRRIRRQSRAAPQGDVDLVRSAGGGAGHVEPKVEPFRASSTGGPRGFTPSRTESGYEAGQMVQTDPNFAVYGVDTPGSIPFPTPSPGFFGTAGAPSSNANTQFEAGDQGPTSPYVAPMPDRAAFLRGPSDLSGPQDVSTSPSDSSMGHGYYAFPPPNSGVSSSDSKEGFPLGVASAATSATSQHPLPPIPLGGLAPTEFRRHTDEGEIPEQGGQQGGVVDLPPLYTDVPARRAAIRQQQQQQR